MEASVITCLIDETDPRFAPLRDKVISRSDTMEILWIEEVINDALLAKFLLTKEDFELTCGGNNVEELQLFHGTKIECLRKIMQEGFKKSCNTRSAYGVGTYLAKDAITSLGYIVPDGEIHFLFLCDVLIGRKCLHTKPTKEIEYFDCFVDSEKNPTVYVVPHDAAIYPRYVIALGKSKNANNISYATYRETTQIPSVPKGTPLEKQSRSGFSRRR